MSRSRSESGTATADPLRPSDHAEAEASDITQPALGVVGWLRWGWRQLTSMRTALVLLLLLAIAAVPGSLVPQRSADPNGVTQYFADNPDLAPVLDNLSMFDVYSSPWFSAIYILLFISLIGCVIPRTKHHWKALRAKPPRTPARLARLDAHRSETVELYSEADAAAAATSAIEAAQQQLKKAGYRVERYDSGATLSVSAERGYLRETGNLVFHASLVGVLLAVGFGGGFTYTGQTVILEGRTFVNTMLDYTSFNPGRFVDEEALEPYALTLDRFDVTYQPLGAQGQGQAGDFVANLTTQYAGEQPVAGEVRVNHPLDMGGDRIYLMGNGYAPTLTVRDADGEIVFSESVPFLPQDTNMTSLGVVKITDGLPDDTGMRNQFFAEADAAETRVYTVGIGPGSDRGGDTDPAAVQELQLIANTTGGLYVGAASPDRLNSLLQAFVAASTDGVIVARFRLSSTPAPGTTVSGRVRMGNDTYGIAQAPWTFLAPVAVSISDVTVWESSLFQSPGCEATIFTLGQSSAMVSSNPALRLIAVVFPVRPSTWRMLTSSPPASSHMISAEEAPWPYVSGPE